MKGFDDVLTEMDFDFISSGQHAISVEGVRKALGNDHFIFLDVRTELEQGYMVFPFATNIPLHELPKRINELPKDKFIILFCTSIFRSAVAYTYLRANGFDEVKGLTASMENLVGIFKPGPLAKM
ncbi:Rhodanese-related sulfurtransferase [Maridesulfovibrio ferrireducens]|uniref:Rhodanese-related sulfurtransferase n=1 Tax=Maridesulfovibrio ferrireducens TaxID=246191 RepID=A0A1G9KLN8_9BACT|nr:rhodanese-like domain-containing protein [Maridesulfovibrio ferrireducens]SDL50295.1 Rhodanese-related sulfurtransferase [Maridesulfovibrio ferrireducens]